MGREPTKKPCLVDSLRWKSNLKKPSLLVWESGAVMSKRCVVENHLFNHHRHLNNRTYLTEIDTYTLTSSLFDDIIPDYIICVSDLSISFLSRSMRRMRIMKWETNLCGEFFNDMYNE